jgi:hypothetical protein
LRGQSRINENQVVDGQSGIFDTVERIGRKRESRSHRRDEVALAVKVTVFRADVTGEELDVKAVVSAVVIVVDIVVLAII